MKLAFALYDGFSALDFAALYEPLARQGCDWATCAQTTDIYDAFGLHFYPTRVAPTLAGYEAVIVPGGPGALKHLEQPAFLRWLATAGDSTEQNVVRLVAIGEGTLLLAAAGLARGLCAAALPEWAEQLAIFGVQPSSKRMTIDSPLAAAISAAGAPALLDWLMNSPGSTAERQTLFAREESPAVMRIPVTGEASQPPVRQATITRQTGETQVEVRLDIDGSGRHDIKTGLPFLDHMLTQVAVHGLFDLYIQAQGDVEIDPHHTLEDVALTLGTAFQQALGDRAGIVRMASADCPMDEALAWVALDFSGRPYSIIQADWHAPMIGSLPTSLFAHFMESFAINARCNLHAAIRYGRDDHHQAEALFKAFGRALCAAIRIDPRRAGQVPSSKGILF